MTALVIIGYIFLALLAALAAYSLPITIREIKEAYMQQNEQDAPQDAPQATEPREERTSYTTPNRFPKPMRDDMARFRARMERERRNAK